MDLITWFHWVFASPGYFLLTLAGLIVLIGLIGGLTDSRTFNEADAASLDEEEPPSGKPWWTRDEEHYREWSAFQVREAHREANSHAGATRTKY